MKYLIVANGPFLSKSIIAEAAQEAHIIALDGAANMLVRLGIIPNIILGDFDSFQEEEVFKDIEKITLPDQDFTDFQKALHYAKQNATSIHVVCATGGRMDHEQAALKALQGEHSSHCPIYLHNECQTITFASNQTIKIMGKNHDHCGIFGMPVASMSVKNGGLEYVDQKPYHLLLSQCSSSNRLIGDEGAIVEIMGHALIVNPPMLLAQRAFSAKSRVEQLTELLMESQFSCHMK